MHQWLFVYSLYWITYVLEGNTFSGTVPTDIFTFPKLEDLNLGKYIDQSA